RGAGGRRGHAVVRRGGPGRQLAARGALRRGARAGAPRQRGGAADHAAVARLGPAVAPAPGRPIVRRPLLGGPVVRQPLLGGPVLGRPAVGRITHGQGLSPGATSHIDRITSSIRTIWPALTLAMPEPAGLDVRRDTAESGVMTMHLETRAIHAPAAELNGSRPVSVPIYQTSVFAFDDVAACARALDDPGAGFAYSRYANPTTSALEAVAADLEGGTAALATSSGMGAINAVLLGLLRPGDHVIAQQCLYGGTFAVFTALAARYGIDVSYVSGRDPA